MEFIYKTIYNLIAYPTLLVIAKTSSIFDKKIKKAFQIHKNSVERWEQKAKSLDANKKRIWFHVSSTGELEQARPVIEMLKKESGDKISIILSYYSPTVQKIAENYEYADICDILPIDTKGRVSKVINAVKPDIMIFVTYDAWPNILWFAKSKNIPIFMISAALREKSLRILPFIGKSFSRSIYSKMSYIGTAFDEDSKHFLMVTSKDTIVKTVGDTRFDRVIKRKENATTLKVPNKLNNSNKPVLICGSTWHKDENILLPVIARLHKKDYDFISIVAPHEPTEARINYIRKLANKHNIEYNFYSEIQNKQEIKNVIILDSVGFLAELYKIGTFCYVGGGFLTSGGVHNCMEPAVMGLPLSFGPNYHNSIEACKMIDLKIAHSVKYEDELLSVIQNWLDNPDKCLKQGQRAKEYIQQSAGATQIYTKDILDKVL